MKTRQGFVSNSSSSSFIVGIKLDKAECPHCHRKDANFFDRIETLGERTWDDTKLRARGIEKTVECLKEWGSWDGVEIRDLSQKMSELEAKGFEIGWVEISYHDDALNDEFRALRETGKVEVVLNNC